MATPHGYAAAEAAPIPRLQAYCEAPAPFPGQGDELLADDTAPDYPLNVYMQAFHNEIPGADYQPEEQEETPGATPEGPYPGAVEAAPEEVPAELAHQQELTRIKTLAALTPEQIHAMTEEEKALLREDLEAALKTATTVEARVRIVARYMDVYML